MKTILTVLFIFFYSLLFGQQYTLTTFQSEYREIKNYNSLQLETLGDISESKTFELDFTFPYFDRNYQEVQLTRDGVLSFPDQIDFSLRLLTFIYDWDAVWDISDIPSDIRYKDTIVDNRKALVIQFTRMRLSSDTSIEEFDSYINFQYWLYEDGVIELVLGERNLDNSPVYVPGEGFYLLTSDQNIRLGPELALYHPTDENIRYSYEDFDSHEERILRNDSQGGLDWLPPKGWTIRFKNETVATNNLTSNEQIKIYPNPVSNTLYVFDRPFDMAIIYDNNGQEAMRINDLTYVDVSALKPGIYSVKVILENNVSTQKFIKQ